MEPQQDPFAESRRLGQLEAEAFDHALRERERREREERLSRLALGAEGADEEGVTGGRAAAAEPSEVVWRLQRDVERLAAFHQAVTRSRAWRLIQTVRRPFGRAW